MEKGHHVFKVKNYSLHSGVNMRIESEEFFVGGHGWKIQFYPGGKTVDAHNSGFVSVYICHNSPTTVQYLLAWYLARPSGKPSGKDMDCIYSTFDENLSFTCISADLIMGCTEFIKRADIEAYVENDCLRICAVIRVLNCVNEDLHVIRLPQRMWSDYGKLLQSKQGADVFFKVGNERFCGHKWILTARCPVFLSHLSDCPGTKDIYIPNVEPKIFEVMLWFVYTGTLPEDVFDDDDFGPLTVSSFMGKLLSAADRFELQRLKNICESRISERISGESVAYLLQLAELCHAKELKAACLRFEAENEAGLLDVMDSDGREYLKETCPLLFLELGYKASYSTNGRQEHNLCGKILSTMKETVVSMLVPQHETYKRKMKKV